MSAPRVGVIGARRARDGLGPFVVRDLRGAGAQVPCFLATRPETLGAARLELERIAGGSARGYLDIDRMLADEPLDALAILSPHETHASFLERAAAAGLHALCEKPLVWGDPEPATRASHIVERFTGAGLALFENCQWPHALPDFERLHPGSLRSPPRRFAMGLAPTPDPERLVGDALPHPLSLLQALAPHPEPRLDGARVESTHGPGGPLTFRFVYRAGSCAVEVRVELRPSDTRPRGVWLEIDGRRATRTVASGYALALSDGERQVPMGDPLPGLLGGFVRAVAGDDPDRARRHVEIATRARLLVELSRAWQRRSGG